MSEKIQTVNVIEMIEGFIEQVFSFNDNESGNKEAEELFKKMIKETQGKDEEMDEDTLDSYCEDGYYASGNGDEITHELIITHST